MAESEARLQLAVDAAELGTWDLDLITDTAPVRSLRHDQMFGYKDLQPGWGQAIWERHVVEEDRPVFREAFERARQTGVLSCEVRVRWPDASVHWIAPLGRTYHDEAGRPVRMVGVVADVTERKRAETALADSEARFRAAVQAVSGILWTNNAEGRMEGEQPGWAALTGQSQEEYQGYGWAKAVHPEDAQPTVDAWNAAVSECGTFIYEHRVRRHDGVWRRFAIRAIPALREDGTVREWVGVHTDVTEQREAEAALAGSEARLRDLVETLNLGTFVARTLDGTIRFWSEGCARLYGWTAEEAIGRTTHDLLRTKYPLPLSDIEAAVERDGTWNGDLRHVNRDGQELVVAAHIVLRQAPDADTPVLLEALTDVIAQRKAESALAELNRHLEERVREAVTAREVALERAKHAQHMQVLGQIAAGVAPNSTIFSRRLRAGPDLGAIPRPRQAGWPRQRMMSGRNGTAGALGMPSLAPR